MKIFKNNKDKTYSQTENLKPESSISSIKGKSENKVRNKIFIKLVFYFGISLLLFSIVTGSVFAYMYMQNTVSLNIKNLEKRAKKISETLSRTWYSDSQLYGADKNPNMNQILNGNMGREMRNDGPRHKNMKIIADIAMAEVWIIEADTGVIVIPDRKGKNIPDSYFTLPPNAEEVINTALNGIISTTENFNTFLDKRSITTAAPIFKGGKVIGAVLLHSPVEDISSALSNGIYTLILSILAALLLAGSSAILLSLSFTKPLNKIKNTSLMLADGNYEVETHVNLNDEIGDLARTIDSLAVKLYKSSKESEYFEKMRQDFIINVSHELRTPVTVIRGSMEAICDGIITDARQIDEYHHQILADSIHLQKLVNDLIDLSKLQNTDFSIEKVPLNLCEIAYDAVRSMKQPASIKNISLEVLCKEEGLHSWLFFGDYHRIRQMIIIILDNAIKFSPENKAVKVTIEQDGENYRLKICDEGNGIAENEIDKIFDRFHKSDNEENKNGMGLGLAIAKQIAIRHGIDISVESSHGKGTVFSFIFPKYSHATFIAKQL